MQTLVNYDNSSERLQENKADLKDGFSVTEVISEHALEFRQELADVSRLMNAMENSKQSEVVKQWATRSEEWAVRNAVNSNMIGKVTGLSTGMSLAETSKVYTEKSKLKDLDEFGDLRKIDIEGIDTFLDTLSLDVSNEVSSETQQPETVNTMLDEARMLVQSLALDNPVSDGRFEVFSASNDQFILDA